jgi:hypothetical protein
LVILTDILTKLTRHWHNIRKELFHLPLLPWAAGTIRIDPICAALPKEAKASTASANIVTATVILTDVLAKNLHPFRDA